MKQQNRLLALVVAALLCGWLCPACDDGGSDGDGDVDGDADGDVDGDIDGDIDGDGDGDSDGDGDVDGDVDGDADGDAGPEDEVCDNGVDDDEDGFTDCDDPDCYEVGACVGMGIHVATAGMDTPGCGAFEEPCRTIGHGIDQAESGQAVYVHTGTYDESWLQVGDGIRVLSVGGLHQARIYSADMSAVRFDGVSDASIEGFEIYGDLDVGGPVDGLVRVLDSSNIVIRNCLIHDAPGDADVIKVSGHVDGLLIDRVMAYNPAERESAGGCGDVSYQEVIDIFGSDGVAGEPPPVRNVIVRGSWLFHTSTGGDWLIYSKINAENIIYENNIFGPSAGGGCGNAAVGIGTAEAGIPDATASVVTHAIVRNNVFAGCRGDAALAIMNSEDSWVYNNTFYDTSGPLTRSVVMFRGNTHPVGAVHLFNNVFYNNYPEKDGAVFYWVRDALPDPLFHDNNLYFENITATDLDYDGEASGVFDNPGLAEPTVPNISDVRFDHFREMAEDFALTVGSPALDAGLDAVARSGHPAWDATETGRRWDIFGAARPAADSWDLGVHELAP